MPKNGDGPVNLISPQNCTAFRQVRVVTRAAQALMGPENHRRSRGVGVEV